jgi:hypothetical protein
MPRHQQVTTCRMGGGPVSKRCSCAHCTFSVCAICGASEGALTTDCPGEKVAFDRQQEVYETNYDYTDERGWHQGEPTKSRKPHFASTRLPPEPPRVDPRAALAPSIDWAVVDRAAYLQHDLAQKAIAWVLADRETEDHSATLTRLEDEIDKQLPRRGEKIVGLIEARELLAKLEHEKMGFHLASQRAEKCDDAFRQAARSLVNALEETRGVPSGEMLFTRTCGCTVVAGTACPHFIAASNA